MIGIRPVQGRLQLTHDPDPIPKVYPTANLCKKLLTCGKMQSNLDPINQLVPRKSALAPVRIITRYYAHIISFEWYDERQWMNPGESLVWFARFSHTLQWQSCTNGHLGLFLWARNLNPGKWSPPSLLSSLQKWPSHVERDMHSPAAPC